MGWGSLKGFLADSSQNEKSALQQLCATTMLRALRIPCCPLSSHYDAHGTLEYRAAR